MDQTTAEEEIGEFSVGIWEYVVGYTQYIILRLIESQPGITTPQIKENPNLSSANGVYSLQKNGLIYSKQTLRDRGRYRGATEWYLTKVGEAHLEKYEDWPKFESWGAVKQWRAEQRKLEPVLPEIPLPRPTLEITLQCTSSSGEHSKLPTGKCLYCGKDVQ